MPKLNIHPGKISATRKRSEAISDELIKRIINGSYPIGSKLPTERDMSKAFGATRHVVREALKRLEALGLVMIRQGSGAHVQNYHLTGGLELIDMLLLKNDRYHQLSLHQEVFLFPETFR